MSSIEDVKLATVPVADINKQMEVGEIVPSSFHTKMCYKTMRP